MIKFQNNTYCEGDMVRIGAEILDNACLSRKYYERLYYSWKFAGAAFEGRR
jgi:hypothetical protein